MINLGATYENLDQKAYQVIKKMIEEGQLLPGKKVSQEKLARDLGISRTPLVSALKYLEKEKLVEAIPRRGFRVRMFTREEMVHIFELREVLEGLTARRAATIIQDEDIVKLNEFFKDFRGVSDITDYGKYSQEDKRFHKFVTSIGAKEFLKSILETYNIISFSYQLGAFAGLVRKPNETIEEHRSVIEAISDRDAASAEELMRRHFKKSAASFRKGIGKKSNG